MCYCGNALVGIHETSPLGDGNLADRGVIKIFFKFQKTVVLFAFRKNVL